MESKKKPIKEHAKEIGRSFAYFKTSVHLGDFLRAKGNDFPHSYFVEHRESTKANPKFKKFNNNKEHVDTVAVFLGAEDGNFYLKSWDAGLNEKAATIYDFLIKEFRYEGQHDSLKKVHKYLIDLEAKKEIYASSDSNKKIVNQSSSDKRKYFLSKNKVLELKDTSYLLERGLSKEILNVKNIKKTIKNIPFYHKGTKTTQLNTAFLLKGTNGYTSYSLRNKIEYPVKTIDGFGIEIPKDKQEIKVDTFKGFPFDKADAIYLAYLPKNILDTPEKEVELKDIKKIDEIALFESSIDGLSYYQMNQNNCQEENILLTSYEGTPSNSQHLTLSKLIEHYEPDRLNFGFDNDPAGGKFALETLTNKDNLNVFSTNFLKENSILRFLNFDSTEVENKKKYMKFLISGKDLDLSNNEYTATILAAKLSEEIKNINRYFKEIGAEKISLTFKVIDDNKKEMVCELGIKKEDAIYLTEKLSESQFKENKIVFSIANNKDFNTDLKEEISELKTQTHEIEKPKNREIKL